MSDLFGPAQPSPSERAWILRLSAVVRSCPDTLMLYIEESGIAVGHRLSRKDTDAEDLKRRHYASRVLDDPGFVPEPTLESRSRILYIPTKHDTVRIMD